MPVGAVIKFLQGDHIRIYQGYHLRGVVIVRHIIGRRAAMGIICGEPITVGKTRGFMFHGSLVEIVIRVVAIGLVARSRNKEKGGNKSLVYYR